MENKINQNIIGLNLDSVSWQIKESQITFAMNANIQSQDGNSVTYTNEPSNQVCLDFKDTLPGFKIVGVKPIIEQGRVMVFLAHPDGRSEIGYISNNDTDCQSIETVEEDCGCAAGTHVVATVVDTLGPDITITECPAGYSLNTVTGFCEKIIYTTIQEGITGQKVISSCNTACHGINAPKVYTDNWTTKTPPTYGTVVAATLTQSFWGATGSCSFTNTYIKQIGIQADIDNSDNPCTTQETPDFLGFTETVCITSTKRYYLGISGDDSLRISVDGNLILDFNSSDVLKSFPTVSDLWANYHLFPITLTQGSHVFKFEYKNVPSGAGGNRGMFAYELYDISFTQLTAAGLTKAILQNTRVLSSGKSISSEEKRKGRILSFSYTGTSTGSGTYNNVAATGGTGSGATFDVVITSGVITSITINNPGINYTTVSTITLPGSSLGGSSPANNLTLTLTLVSEGGKFIDITQACPEGYTLSVNENCVASCKKLDQKVTITKVIPGTCCVYTPLIKDICQKNCTDSCVDLAIQNKSYPHKIISFIYTDCLGTVHEIFLDNTDSNYVYNVFFARKGSYSIPKNVTVTETKAVDPIPNTVAKEFCCLNLSVEHPVEVEYRIDGCKTRIYFIANNIAPKTFYWTENDGVLSEVLGLDDCQNEITCIKDACHKFDLFPEFCQAEIYPISVESGGRLKAGMYSFSVSYCEQDGKEITDYLDLSNPISIFERKITEQTEYETSKSIKVRVEHKTTNFEFFNLIVAENVNEVTNYHLIGTYRVNKVGIDELIYTGDYKSTFSSIFPLVRTPHYKAVNIIEKQNDILMLGGLTETPKYNFQLIANQLELNWETVEMPADGKFDYSNPEIAYMFRTYQRDEVYPFGIKFKLKNGKYTDVFHIPGRKILSTDLTIVPSTNLDAFVIDDDCIQSLPSLKWQVYNTAYGATPAVSLPTTEFSENQYDCKITPSQRGKFAYWQSTETYPCVPEVWGPLAGQPIRFHKFPDSNLTHIHDGKNLFYGDVKGNNSTSKIYPIGVRLDEALIGLILNTYTVFDPLTNTNIKAVDLICGYELVRGNRVNNKSVIAKGLVYDVGKVELRKRGPGQNDVGGVDRTYYFSNYPFNDLNADPYLANCPSWYDSAQNNSPTASNKFIVNPFNYLGTNKQQDRFTFYSPDTTFQYPKIGTELKLETIEYGKVLGHFVPVEDHPQYKFMTDTALTTIALISALSAYIMQSSTATTVGVTSGVTATGNITIDIKNQLTQFQLLYDIVMKLIPYQNFAWQYNGIATYNNFTPIANTGDKRRVIDKGFYANDKIVDVQDNAPLHNRLRETSVYLKTTNKFTYQNNGVVDNSRYVISSLNNEFLNSPQTLDENHFTRAYYVSVKRNFPNQYGQLQNIKYISTGYIVDIIQDPQTQFFIPEPKYYPAFGGDTFINKFALKRKHSFFTRNLVNLPATVNDVPFDYWQYPNTAYPAYYIGNSPDEVGTAAILTLTALALAAVIIYIAATTGGHLSALAAVAVTETIGSMMVGLYGLQKPNVNLDNKTEAAMGFHKKGHFYTASYGIPIFFVESDINVDFRHGRDDTKENFYPNVGTGVPDEWLQEKNVPIKFDNFYHYNATYSAQNQSPNLPYIVNNPSKDCLTIHPNRVIYSSPANTDSYYSDAWKTYKRGDYYDFPKEGGRLIDLNSGENERVYARFENTTKIYNARVVMESTAPVQLEIGNASMFSQKPLDLSKTDLGFMGSQHKAIVKTEHGIFWADAKRGNIYQLSAQGFNNLVKDQNYNWFKQNLPFQLLKDFPNADIDNPAKGVGIIMGWDLRYQRVFITKLDYKLIDGVAVTYDSDPLSATYGKYFRTGTSTEVFFSDKTVFENKSWTVAYSPTLQNFISFYSFLPNYYVPLVDHFQTITNTSTGASTWNHNLNALTYQTYYGKLYPYILEYSANSMPKTSMVNSVTLVQDIQEYFSNYEYYSLSTGNNENLANFTKAIIYNKEQSSGVVTLISEIYGNKAQKIAYPRMTGTGIETLIGRRENVYSFNGFWSISSQGSGQPIWSTKWTDIQNQYPIDKVPSTKSVRPVSVSYQKQKIKSDFCKVRLIQDQYNRYKFINHIQITQIQP